MANNINLSLFWICNSSILFLFIFNVKEGWALGGRDSIDTSLLLSSVCNSSAQGPKRIGSLTILHRYGPCSHFPQHKANALTHSQILAHDQSRFNTIRYRISSNRVPNSFQDSKVTIPAISDDYGYVVTVGLGNPTKELSMTFDTGSDLTWTQCEPCVVSCYKQQQPIFDPSMSTTYSNITCKSRLCSSLISATGNRPGCAGSTCLYALRYGDGSTTVGYFGKDMLTLSRKNKIKGFLFGCGQNNKGTFGKTAGLLGLGRDKLSIISQNVKKYKNYFSYCLPSISSSKGYLTLGKGRVSKNVKYTPFASSRGTSFYFIDLIEIYVGETKLSISPIVFSSPGVIIDSGTFVTRLPPLAYNALRTEFQRQMATYPKAEPVSQTFLDTCYDFTNYKTVTVPKISFVFGGNVKVDASKTLLGSNLSQVCLAFAGNSDSSDIGILGSVQQEGIQVVYDVARGKLGFGESGCA